ncbi:hypothetical protein B0J12DRAFT_138732 [Macrophomina phaseolina]|uniref:Secreted protein n=1 Tax=Macrophomina phaseolina TaxID=35725 RepID=A0ABQ8G769_9PEZI|nr:hypothetical protein B0J12DRAFT_138732 [Macrophomina phaseolina]
MRGDFSSTGSVACVILALLLKPLTWILFSSLCGPLLDGCAMQQRGSDLALCVAWAGSGHVAGVPSPATRGAQGAFPGRIALFGRFSLLSRPGSEGFWSGAEKRRAGHWTGGEKGYSRGPQQRRAHHSERWGLTSRLVLSLSASRPADCVTAPFVSPGIALLHVLRSRPSALR